MYSRGAKLTESALAAVKWSGRKKLTARPEETDGSTGRNRRFDRNNLTARREETDGSAGRN
jgi:hypothetical protein